MQLGWAGPTVPVWGVSRAVSHLGKGCIEIKITRCHSVPGACSQVRARQSCRGSHSFGVTSPLALPPPSGAAPGPAGAQGGRAGHGVSAVEVWSAIRMPHGCHGVWSSGHGLVVLPAPGSGASAGERALI